MGDVSAATAGAGATAAVASARRAGVHGVVRELRSWPTLLKRGGEWPWIPEQNVRAVTFARICEETRKAGRKLTERDLADRLKGDKSQVHRAIDANRKEYDRLCNELDTEEF